MTLVEFFYIQYRKVDSTYLLHIVLIIYKNNPQDSVQISETTMHKNQNDAQSCRCRVLSPSVAKEFPALYWETDEGRCK